jgi:hypothetical protein
LLHILDAAFVITEVHGGRNFGGINVDIRLEAGTPNQHGNSGGERQVAETGKTFPAQ